AGVVLDRLIVRVVPERVAAELEAGLSGFVDDPRLDDDEAAPRPEGDDRLTSRIGDVSLHDLADDDRDNDKDRSLVALMPPDPYRFTLGEIRDLWREAVNAATQARRP